MIDWRRGARHADPTETSLENVPCLRRARLMALMMSVKKLICASLYSTVLASAARA